MNRLTYFELGQGISCVDTEYLRPGLAACYLIESNRRVAFVDTGTYHTVAPLLRLLEARGVAPEQVDYVMPTHVHLDHAGGAFELMRHLPVARLVVHPAGAPHMVDPSKLISGSVAVYGEQEFRKRFGTLTPVPKERLIEAQDGMKLELGGRSLMTVESPGHARHHYCVYDERTQGFFTGDSFGLSYREFDSPRGPFLFATTTPVQFDPDAWLATLDRLLAFQPRRMYLTHFGMVRAVDPLARQLKESIQAFADIARNVEQKAPGDERLALREQLFQYLYQALDRHDCSLPRERRAELLEMDVELNAQGLQVWLARRRKQAQRGSD